MKDEDFTEVDDQQLEDVSGGAERPDASADGRQSGEGVTLTFDQDVVTDNTGDCPIE